MNLLLIYALLFYKNLTIFFFHKNLGIFRMPDLFKFYIFNFTF